MIDIDGSVGEGGGQILRSSLALSVITAQPFRIRKIRAGRAKPGLLRQHLTAVRAAAEICGGAVEGAELGSTELRFTPGAARAGTYRFAIGSAGSANLVLQTVLLPLALAGSESLVELEGGTHNPTSPPHSYLLATFLPLLARMGPEVDLSLGRWGFYPAGGGHMTAAIGPVRALKPLFLEERGEVRSVRVFAAVGGDLPLAIGHRELVTACRALGVPLTQGKVLQVNSPGPGNVVWIEVVCEHTTEVFTAFGEKAVRSEVVAERAAGEARAWLAADVPVAEYTADQLLLPMALAGTGAFVTAAPSEHARTNAALIPKFLPVKFDFAQQGAAWRVSVGPAA